MTWYEFKHDVKGGIYWTYDGCFPKNEQHYIKKYRDFEKEELTDLVCELLYDSNDNYKLKTLSLIFETDKVSPTYPVLRFESKKHMKHKYDRLVQCFNDSYSEKIIQIRFDYATYYGTSGVIILEKHYE